jgi:diguanylate cyclase (GGDEF)-like protein
MDWSIQMNIYNDNLGEWTWQLTTNIIDVEPMRYSSLGYVGRDLPTVITIEFFNEKIYVEDYSEVRDKMLALILGEIDRYEVVYRIRKKDSGYRWLYDKCEVIEKDDLGKPLTAHGYTLDVTSKMTGLEKNGDFQSKKNFHDILTQINNRHTMLEHLAIEIEKSHITMDFIVVSIITINDFKTINEVEGHIFGDHVLRRTADILRESVDELDIVGRYGGDQFMIIFIGKPENVVVGKTNEILKEIETYHFGNEYPIKLNSEIVSYQNEPLIEFVDRLEQLTV